EAPTTRTRKHNPLTRGRPPSDVTHADDAERAFDDHEAFEAEAEGYAVTTTPLGSRVRTETTADGVGVSYRVIVTPPTLDAV
ncbi:MAG: DUF5813 family protein, partial [Planctomycetota bacterium]